MGNKRQGRKHNPERNGIPLLPQKRFYRQRAHANPFSDHQLDYPRCPEEMDWSHWFPNLPPNLPATQRQLEGETQPSTQANPQKLRPRHVEILDIGCGFGGLLVALAPIMPDTLLLGLEIRAQVAQYVQTKIAALRSQNSESGTYQNIACFRANAMKFLPNFLYKGQLSKVFICFPDPHFKSRKHKARIVSTTLNTEYAFLLRPGGIVYTITDVAALHEWIVEHFDAHPSFEQLSLEDQENDQCVRVMSTETEEGKKVDKNGGRKYIALYRRLEDPVW